MSLLNQKKMLFGCRKKVHLVVAKRYFKKGVAVMRQFGALFFLDIGFKSVERLFILLFFPIAKGGQIEQFVIIDSIGKTKGFIVLGREKITFSQAQFDFFCCQRIVWCFGIAPFQNSLIDFFVKM